MRKRKRAKTSGLTQTVSGLYLPGALGCHCAAGVSGTPSWLVRRRALSDEEVPAFEPGAADEDMVTVEFLDCGDGLALLQVANNSNKTMAAYVSGCATLHSGAIKLIGGNGSELEVGTARVPLDDLDVELGEAGGQERGRTKRKGKRKKKSLQNKKPSQTEVVDCITFVVSLQKRTAAVLATALDLDPWLNGVATISTFAFELKLHPAPALPQPPMRVFQQFPLPGQGPYLCTQTCGGMLTHYMSESHHAIDFRCEVGTPLLAMADGVVTEIIQDKTVSGIHCLNLMHWNSIAVQVADGVVIEYVHIKPRSAVVCVGEKVVAGQQLCLSGDIGFSPEPHVHIEAHLASDLHGPSIPIHLAAGGDPSEPAPSPYVPLAGKWYGPNGLASAPS